MRLSNPGAHTAHTVAGDVTGDVRAPLAFAAQPLGADHFLNFTATGGKPDHRSRADTITLIARAAELRCGSGSELMQDEMMPATCRRGLDDCYACVPTCGLLHLRVQNPDSPQCVGIQAAPVTSPMNKGSPSGPL